jgi:hypothetical protein
MFVAARFMAPITAPTNALPIWRHGERRPRQETQGQKMAVCHGERFKAALSEQIINNSEISQKLVGEQVPMIYKALKTTA